MSRRDGADEGVTLVECLITIAILGIAFVALMGGMFTFQTGGHQPQPAGRRRRLHPAVRRGGVGAAVPGLHGLLRRERLHRPVRLDRLADHAVLERHGVRVDLPRHRLGARRRPPDAHLDRRARHARPSTSSSGRHEPRGPRVHPSRAAGRRSPSSGIVDPGDRRWPSRSGFKVTAATTSQLAASHNRQLVAGYFTSDVQSAVTIADETSADTTTCVAGRTDAGRPAQLDRPRLRRVRRRRRSVAYVTATVSGEKQLIRNACTGATMASTVTVHGVVSSNWTAPARLRCRSPARPPQARS